MKNNNGNKSQHEESIDTRQLVFGMFKIGDAITIPLIQRRCACSYITASMVMDNLVNDGLVISSGTSNGIYKLS